MSDPRAYDLYQRALERPSSERDAFLRSVCVGNAGLLTEVRSLLAYDTSGFLETPAFDSLVGTSIGPYRIVSRLGEGGMGVVYRARDERLGREVALKVLPSALASDEERQARLMREARLLAAVSHPHIAAVHGFEDAAASGQPNVRALVLEFVDGRTLADVLSAGPLPVAASIAIARQIAQALAAAHGRGIIHRDLKPSNVMLAGGVIDPPDVKLLDFGLAKLGATGAPILGQSAPYATRTNAASVTGTPAYMSPEQARGDAVDHRTDVWSFGCLLFEMLTGRRAFERGTLAETFAAILDRDPDWSALPSTVSAPVVAMLKKCLVKEVAGRLTEIVQVVAVLATAITTSRATSPVFRRRVLFVGAAVIAGAVLAMWAFRPEPAVLASRDTIVLADIVNNTKEPDFDGTIQHALATSLSQSPYINILSEEGVGDTLVMMKRPREEPVTRPIAREICQRRNLKAFLTGSISTVGNHYAISLEVVGGETGDVVVREQTEAAAREEVLTQVSAVAARLRQKLGESLSSIEAANLPLAQLTTTSLEAMRAVLQGNVYLRQTDYTRAVAAYKHATELDPDFATAYSSLYTALINASRRREAEAALQRAWELRDRVSGAERLSIESKYYTEITRELERAIEALDQLESLPNGATSSPFTNRAALFRILGQHERSVEMARESIRLRPDSFLGTINLVQSLERLGRFDEVLVEFKRAAGRGSVPAGLRMPAYRIAVARGDHDLARAQLKWAAGRPEEYQFVGLQADAASAAGRMRESAELVVRTVSLAKRASVVSSAAQARVAMSLAAAGDYRRALAVAGDAAREGTSTGSRPFTAIAIGLCGDAARARSMAAEMSRGLPRGTLEQGLFGPTIEAAVMLASNPRQTLKLLEGARAFDRAAFLRSNYLRGQAHLALKEPAEATTEFQYIVDHRGEDTLSALYPLAHLGLARAAVLAGDTAKARAAYDRFFALWKGADPDVPELRKAKAEFARLK